MLHQTVSLGTFYITEENIQLQFYCCLWGLRGWRSGRSGRSFLSSRLGLLSVSSVLLEILTVAEHGSIDGDDEDLDEDGGYEIAQNDDDDRRSDKADDRLCNPCGAESNHDLHD